MVSQRDTINLAVSHNQSSSMDHIFVLQYSVSEFIERLLLLGTISALQKLLTDFDKKLHPTSFSDVEQYLKHIRENRSFQI